MCSRLYCTVWVCVTTLYDVRTTTKWPNGRVSQNVSPSLSDAWLYLQSDMPPFMTTWLPNTVGQWHTEASWLRVSWCWWRIAVSKTVLLILFCIIFTTTRCGQIWTSWDHSIYRIVKLLIMNPLTPNDCYTGRTASLTSKRCIWYMYSTNIGTEYFKHGIYSPFFSPQNAVCFIILTYLVPVLFIFYIQVC